MAYNYIIKYVEVLKVGRGNDAIPTWSGFNYQGKMMLLYVMNLINKQEKDHDNKKYSVEIEKTEDFCIICNSKYKSFHQVKAYLSCNQWIRYREAMDKLIKHRDSSTNPTAECYLMVARDITDWDDASNTYRSSVKLYKYNSEIVGVRDVKDLIMAEVNKYLKLKGYSEDNGEIVYGALCIFLDDCIASMHKQQLKRRKYSIDFSMFLNIIEATLISQTVREEFYLKEKIYDYIMENMEKALNNLCQDNCNDTLYNCYKSCAAKVAYEKIVDITDYSKFCKLLNPSELDRWDNSLSMIEMLPADKLQNEIYDLLYQSNSPEKVCGDCHGLYLKSKHSHAPKGQIIPTLLDLTRGVRSGNKALQKIFQNIIGNSDIIDILEGNSITAIPGGYKGSLSQAQISSGWRQNNPDKINQFYREIEIISSRELQDIFEEEGGNHD